MDDFMKEAKERIKEAQKTVIFRAIIFVVAGLLMIIWPLKVADFVCYGIALVLVVFGTRFILSYLKKDPIQDFFKYDLVINV